MDVDLKPRIVVFGVGGAGGNAVDNMMDSSLQGVEFVVANTDAQALSRSGCEKRVQLGPETTQGLGAGARPDIGAAAAEESIEEIKARLKDIHMCFIAAGMGGGTGTGAAPVIAREAAAQNVLTVGVVTKPFDFEGRKRQSVAGDGIEQLRKQVDTLVIIPNQNLFRVANASTTFADAFGMADRVLYSAVRGITDLMVMPGLINLDFADVRTVMAEMGAAMMGTGEGEGENRAVKAAQAAIANPLLDDVSMKGARGVLINITGGPDMTLFEVDEAANEVRSEVDPNAQIILGSTFDNEMEGIIRVSVVATGIEENTPAEKEAHSSSSRRAERRSKPAQEPTPIITARTLVELDPEQDVPETLVSDIPESNGQDRSGIPALFGWKKSASSGSGNAGSRNSGHAARQNNGTGKPGESGTSNGNREFNEASETHETRPSDSLARDEELEIPAFLRRSGHR